MKKIGIVVALMLLIASNVSAIDDGWYETTIKYQNLATGTRATYTLNVKVQYGNVVKIDFGNGGSLHSGVNNSGYLWSGGYISQSLDYYSNSYKYTSKVTVITKNGSTLLYDITF